MNTDLIASMSSAPATWLNVAELPSPTIGSRSPVFGTGRVMTPAACARCASRVVDAVDAHPDAAPSASTAPARAVKAKYSRRVNIGRPLFLGESRKIASRLHARSGAYGISRLAAPTRCASSAEG